MSLALLKQQLAEIVDGPSPESGTGLPTGVRALDAALAGGGIPRGRLTEIVGARGSGKTTLVRLLAEQTVRAGGGVAYVDARRTLAPQDWVSLGTHDDVWFVRPHNAARAAWCADVLLRSGAFTLVVLDGAPALTRAVAVRLVRLARDAAAALVVIGDEHGGGSATVGGAVRLRCTTPAAEMLRLGRGHRRAARQRNHVLVSVEKGGKHHSVEVRRAIRVARRLCTHSEVPDRRGVAPDRAPGAGARDSGGAAAHALSQRAGARSRRCGEARVGPEGIFGADDGSRPLGHTTDRPRG